MSDSRPSDKTVQARSRGPTVRFTDLRQSIVAGVGYSITIPVLLMIAAAISIAADANASPREVLVKKAPHPISAHWCASGALVLQSRASGIQWIDIRGKRQVNVADGMIDLFHGCTFDGKWVVYSDGRSNRLDRFGNNVPHEWDGGVVDLWRYEIASGRRQRFAVVRSVGGYQALAPSTLTILLGGRHFSSVRMPPPQWNAIWFKENWNQNAGLVWFRDSSGIVMHDTHNEMSVEIFGKVGWYARFEPDLGQLQTMRTDPAGRLYVLTERDTPGEPVGGRLHRCAIGRRGLVGCQVLLRGIGPYDVLPDGRIIFQDPNGKDCIRSMVPGQSAATCLVDARGFPELALWDASPDGRWLAFSRRRPRFRYPSDTSAYVELYVADLQDRGR